MRNALLREIHQREDLKRLIPLLAELLKARITSRIAGDARLVPLRGPDRRIHRPAA